MKQRVALIAVLAGLVVGLRLATAAGVGGPSPSAASPPAVDPLICLDEWLEPRPLDCRPEMLNDEDDPPVIDLRPAYLDPVDV